MKLGERRKSVLSWWRGSPLRWGLLVLLLVAGVAPAERSVEVGEGSPVTAQPVARLELSLREAILTALERNLDIRIERFNPLIREAAVLEALGQFDTSVFLTSTLHREKSPPTTVFLAGAPQRPASITDTFSVGLGVRGRTTTGASLQLSYENVRTANPPDPGIQNAVLGAQVTQPLLRGAWATVNLSGVRIARNSRRASIYDFQDAVINVIAEVERAYWNLVFSHGNLAVQQRSLQLAEELLQSNRERVAAGILAPSEIIRAESSVAARQAEILDAETAVDDAGDALRRLIQSPESDLAEDLAVLPTDAPRREYEPVDIKWAIYQALTQRPDLIAQKTELENVGVELVVAQNELLPTLDLTLFYRSKGAGRSLDTSFDRYSSFLFDDFGASIDFSVPLEQRAAKGSVTQARLKLQQALYELKKSEDAVVVGVRQQLRRVASKHEQIERFRHARDLAGKRLEAENEKLLLGTATTLDVLEAQRELTTAERDELRAAVDFNTALVDLRRAMGALLEDYQVEFREP